jgi:predicted transcriptional regulator
LSNWTLFSNHGHVLLVLADDPEARLRDVAQRVDITERAVQKIVRDLQQEGLLSVSKQGRRNRYRINTRKTLRHPLEANRTIGQLIAMMRDGRLPGATAVARAVTGEPESPREPDTAAVKAERDGIAPDDVEEVGTQVVTAPVLVPEPDSRPHDVPAAAPPADEWGQAEKVEKTVEEESARGKKAGKKKKPPPNEQQGKLF